MSGDDLPVGAGIVAVYDAFDAMISERPYRPPMSTDDALAELRRCAGTQSTPMSSRRSAPPAATEIALLALPASESSPRLA